MRGLKYIILESTPKKLNNAIATKAPRRQGTKSLSLMNYPWCNLVPLCVGGQNNSEQTQHYNSYTFITANELYAI